MDEHLIFRQQINAQVSTCHAVNVQSNASYSPVRSLKRSDCVVCLALRGMESCQYAPSIPRTKISPSMNGIRHSPPQSLLVGHFAHSPPASPFFPARIYGRASQKASPMISTCSLAIQAFCFLFRSFSICVLLRLPSPPPSRSPVAPS